MIVAGTVQDKNWTAAAPAVGTDAGAEVGYQHGEVAPTRVGSSTIVMIP